MEKSLYWGKRRGMKLTMKLNGNDILKEVANKFAEQPNEFPRNGTVDYPRLIDGWIES
jgi:hypothetical protein